MPKENMEHLYSLLEKAKWAVLTPNECAEVAQRIKDFKGDDTAELYTLLHIIGRTQAVENRRLVERFLVYPDEPMISIIALKVLCDYWDFTKSYLSEVKAFIRGVKWDKDQEVRLLAMSIAGEYIRETGDKECLKLLLDIFENQQEEIYLRGAAYKAIARAVGKNWNDIPSVSELFNLPEEIIDGGIIDQAHQMLKKKRIDGG